MTGSRWRSGRSPVTLSSPDRSRLVPLTLDYTRLARSKTNREPVRRLIVYLHRLWFFKYSPWILHYDSTVQFGSGKRLIREFVTFQYTSKNNIRAIHLYNTLLQVCTFKSKTVQGNGYRLLWSRACPSDSLTATSLIGQILSPWWAFPKTRSAECKKKKILKVR